MSEVARLSITVNANTRRAVSELAALDAVVRRTGDSMSRHSAVMDRQRDTINRLSQSHSRLSGVTRRNSGDMDRLGNATNNSSGHMGRFAKIVVATSVAATALFPVMQGGLAVIGGLTSAFTLAGSAAGVFGLAVTSYLKNTKQGQAELTRLSQAFDKFGKSTAGFVSQPVHTFFSGLVRSLRNLVPLVAAVAPVANKVAEAFHKWSGTRLQQWVSFIASKGVPILAHFVSIGRSLGKTFGAAVIQFQPFGTTILSVLDKGAAAMARWAQGGGFSAFMQTVHANGPMVANFFKTLWQALSNITQAMSILGPLGLGLTTMFLKLIAVLPPQVLALMAVGISAIAIATKLWKIQQQGLNLTMLASPFFWVVAAIVALVAAIVWVATKTTWFQTAWKYTWNAIKAATSATLNFLKSIFHSVINFLTGKWGWLIAVIGPVGWLIALGAHWRQVWGFVKAAGSAIWNFLKRAWSGTVNFFRNAANALSGAVHRIWSTLWNWAKSKASAVWNWLKGAWSRTTGALRNSARWVSGAVTGIWRGLWNWVGDKAKAVWNWVLDRAKSFGKSIISRFKDIKDKIGDAWNKLKSIFKAPVKFLIDVVINKGIIGSANWLIDKLGGGKNTIKPVKSPKGFATGGYTGNGGKYTPAGVVHRGEYVLNKESTAKIGVNRLHHMNRTGQVPGYAKGGFAGMEQSFPKIASLKSTISANKKSEGNVEKFLDFGASALGFGAAVDIKDVLKGAGKWIGNVKGAAGSLGGIMGPIFKGLVGKLWPLLKEVFKSVFEANQATGNGYVAGPDWKGGDGNRVSYHGATMDAYTMRLLKKAESIYGALFSISQGSFHAGVGASAGTHDGGGVVDIAQHSNKVVGALRASGFAAWARTPSEGFSPHTHAVAVKDKLLSPQARNQVSDFFKGRNGLADNGPDTYTPPGGGKGSSKGSNRSIVSRVLAELHQSQSNIDNVMRAINKESGGNPRVVNNWDSNARRGTPSKGLLQVIDPTFKAYAGKYKNRSIFDPYANIYAAINYAMHTYGSGWSARMARPGGYATGVRNAPRGLAWVGENGPELMNFRGGESVTPNRQSLAIAGSGGGDIIVNISLNGANLASSRQIEDAVVAAIESAKRKGRRI
ncbi:transglycosylase SLT domain-containing protein [Streptomyces sp. NBC_00006]|uniref:transglycosylase SLT domain-containing protein n=1 Tax=Streptomyces sp. NBC_00006 TaxID=2975619 RepID=UPI00224E658B|nr:transglycosylase SLT domain-containing protein [Streptomyces sp. NBC_00006]MCX5535427.1 transglycosylase SLT domain-containing protein [Streptomyces sp. NBC_00006]